MQTNSLSLLLSILLATTATAQISTNSISNPAVIRQFNIPGTRAPALPTPAPRLHPARPPTNGSPSQPVVALASTLKREIQVTESGAKATWGRTEAFFPPDLSSPISVITPDGRNISFRPTFLVLENRITQETILLGTVTNSSIGTVYLPNSVVWSNIFGSGPRVSLEIVYNASKGSIEQNLLLH